MVFLPQLHSSRYAAVQSLSLAYLSQQEVLVLKQWFFSTTLYVHERNEYIHTVITRQIYLNKMIVGFHRTSHGPLTADCRINNGPNFTATMTESDIVRASHVCKLEAMDEHGIGVGVPWYFLIAERTKQLPYAYSNSTTLSSDSSFHLRLTRFTRLFQHRCLKPSICLTSTKYHCDIYKHVAAIQSRRRFILKRYIQNFRLTVELSAITWLRGLSLLLLGNADELHLIRVWQAYFKKLQPHEDFG